MVSLYRADGSLLMGGVGFLHHLTSAAEACKATIRRFGEDINEGDVFLLNDPYTAALHTSDIYLVAPIHHGGELVAWSACFVHVYDIGATNPGGFCPDAPDIYTEGFSSPGIRLVSGGSVNQDVMDTLLNMVRSPEMVALDMSSMIACNNVARERMLALIEKYGHQTVDQACRTLIEQSETLLRERLRELPDGSWQSRQYIDVKGEVFKVNLTMTKRDDRLVFDFSGSSPQAPYAINCTKWASLGGLFAPLFPLLCYDITWNEGVVRPIEMIAPEGSIVNCTRPAPVSVATVGAIQSVNNAACAAIGKMLDASDKYASEATAVWHANHFAVFMFGRNQHGGEAIGILTETFAGSGGARSFADGIDVGGEIPNPISRMANVETLETIFPLRYLFRRRMTDSGGPGRYRGGAGMEIGLTPHDAPDGGLHYVVSGKGADFPMSEGLAGGYPGAPNSYVWGQEQRGRWRSAQCRRRLQPVDRRPAGRAGARLLGRVSADGRRRALCPLERRWRVRRSPGSRARSGAGGLPVGRRLAGDGGEGSMASSSTNTSPQLPRSRPGQNARRSPPRGSPPRPRNEPTAFEHARDRRRRDPMPQMRPRPRPERDAVEAERGGDGDPDAGRRRCPL